MSGSPNDFPVALMAEINQSFFRVLDFDSPAIE